MNRKIAAAGIEQNAAFDAAIDRIDRGAGLDVQAPRRCGIGERGLHRKPIGLERRCCAGGQSVRNAVVGGADDAADRGGPVTQGCRSADHLDLVGRKRIDRHEVILAEIRRAVAADAVLDDADAIDVEAPDDRPARRARRKARAGDAGLGEQEIAERAAALPADFLVGQHGHGRELVGHDGQARPVEAQPRRGPVAAGYRVRDCGRARRGRRAPAFATGSRSAARSGLAPSR